MAELITKKNKASVTEFLNAVEDVQKRKDSLFIHHLMEELTGEKGVMWGTSIVGYGNYHYTYASGREGDWMLVGFSPRKQNLTLYIMTGFKEYESLMKKLGKFKTGVGCLYIKKLEDIDVSILKQLISKSVEKLRSKK